MYLCSLSLINLIFPYLIIVLFVSIKSLKIPYGESFSGQEHKTDKYGNVEIAGIYSYYQRQKQIR